MAKNKVESTSLLYATASRIAAKNKKKLPTDKTNKHELEDTENDNVSKGTKKNKLGI